MIASMFRSVGSVLLAPIVPKLFQQFGHLPHANYWVPSLLTVPALCIALFSPFVGLLADRIGRRRLLIGAMLVYAFMGLAPLVLDSFWAILATRVGVGICEAVVLTCSTALIGDTFDEARPSDGVVAITVRPTARRARRRRAGSTMLPGSGAAVSTSSTSMPTTACRPASRAAVEKRTAP